MTYKDSDQRTKDYLGKFTKDKVIPNLVGTDKPLILDIGGNIGQSVHRLKEVWEDCTIHSIEPLPEAFKRLHMCQALFSNVTTHNIALGSRNGKQDFYVSEHQPMLSSLYKLNKNSSDSIAINKPENAHKDFLKSKTIKVHVRTLDTFARQNRIDSVDIIKMDAQGSEPDILEHGKDTLKNTKIILTELSFYDLYTKKCSFYDIEKTLIPLGFELYDIAHVSKNPMNGRTDWADVIYFKKN